MFILRLFLACILFSSYSFSNSNFSRLEAYAQMESIILNRPSESLMSVVTVVTNYQKISARWIGKKNMQVNQKQIESNLIFAKTNIFAKTLSSGESQQKILFKRLKYTTGYKDKSYKVSGLLLIPTYEKPKGVVLFFHSTINGKLNVPSFRFADYKSQMLASIFAANGYIVVAPDYLGMGINYKIAHPYILYPEINVIDARDMLLASMMYLKKNGFILSQKRALNLFVSGYSEGASYALWFSRIYQENYLFRDNLNQNQLSLAKTIPIDGAYNLTEVMLPFLLTNQVNDHLNRFEIITPWWGTLLKPSLLVNVMLAYSHFSSYPIGKLLNNGFYNLECWWPLAFSCNYGENIKPNLETFVLSPLKNFSITLSYFFAAIFKTGTNIIYSPLFNSVAALIPEDIIEDSQFKETMARADIINWKSINPITLISLAQDSLVPEQNSSDAYNGLIASGSKNVKYIKFDNRLIKVNSLFGTSIVDHVSFELFALLIALKEIEITKEGSKKIRPSE